MKRMTSYILFYYSKFCSEENNRGQHDSPYSGKNAKKIRAVQGTIRNFLYLPMKEHEHITISVQKRFRSIRGNKGWHDLFQKRFRRNGCDREKTICFLRHISHERTPEIVYFSLKSDSSASNKCITYI